MSDSTADPVRRPQGEPAPMVDRWKADAEAWHEGLADGSISPHPPPMVQGNWRQSATESTLAHLQGLVIGSAVGDALGAPFEFGPAGAFSEHFPPGFHGNEMVGGGIWQPGEFTDDTQMAVLEALSIIDHGGIDEADLFARFETWVRSGPKDVGIMTRTILTDPQGWPDAPHHYFELHPDGSAGNGGIMRSSFSAARWAMAGNYTGTAEVGRRLSRVTHADPAAAEGRALLHMMCRDAIKLGDPFAQLETNLAFLKDAERDLYVELMSDDPPMALPNGTVWGCLRDAVVALRHSDSFEETMRRACDVGDDVDTVAAVAGALAGATFGVADIPGRWTEALHGDVLGAQYRAGDLLELFDQVRLVTEPRQPFELGDKSWLPDR